jgi:hypothetical protein
VRRVARAGSHSAADSAIYLISIFRATTVRAASQRARSIYCSPNGSFPDLSRPPES